MGLAELLAALRDDAEDEIARLDRDASTQLQQLLTDAEQRARALHSEPVEAAEARAAAEAVILLSGARLEAGGILRGAREVAFRAILDDVRDRLAALRDGPAYQSVFAALVRESLAALPAGRTLRIDPRDEAIAARVLCELERGDVTPHACLRTLGGVELASPDGRLLRNTLEERLANAQPDLRLRLAAAAADAALAA
jgi:V/A-type H+/Na+-transporting ATPase subunit E